MTYKERLLLQFEELWRGIWGFIPSGLGTMLRRYLYGPLFAKAGKGLRTGTHVVVQGFRFISLGNGVGLNRHASLYAARGRIAMGNNVFVGDFSSINANDSHISIGNNVAIGPMTLIQGANHNFDDLTVPIVQQGHDNSFVTIDDNVWIAAHCTILPGVHIHSGAVIAAGAVVNKDVPENAVVGGIPAKILRYRGSRTAQ